MQKIKFSLLAATVFAGAAAFPGFADAATPGNYAIPAPGLPVSSATVNGATVNYDGDTALHGAGATSIQNVLVRALNCLGTPYKLGNGQPGQSGAAATEGSLGAKSPGVYAGTGTVGNPQTVCNNTSANVSFTGGTSSYEIQPQLTDASGNNWGFAGKYVGAGSGFGRKSWYYFADVFDSGSSSHAISGVYNPYNLVSGDNRWSHVQFAFSDAPIASSDLANYQTAGNAVTHAGPAIQLPLFVLPVAIAYTPVYGKNASGTNMTFNVLTQASFNGVKISSLHLTAQVYCSIFNGDITNWNDPQITKLNTKTPLFDTVNDTATRWTKDGVPIRLVGRMDASGTTDVFSRHLAQVCSQSSIYTPKNGAANVNKYLIHQQSLPYNSSAAGAPDFRSLRSDVSYYPGSAESNFAGTTNTVSGDWSNGSTIVNINPGVAPSSAPNFGTTPYAGSGLFIVANGGGNLAKTIVLAPDLTAPDGTTLNGKIGYISADFITPSADQQTGLVSASLAVTGAAFQAPTVFNALKAFTTTVGNPPESSSTDGSSYAPGTDTRQVHNASGALVNATRDNPIAWTDVLYETGATLAQPTSGYPITGTTQFFGYTCYATAGNRAAVTELLGTLLGQIKLDANGNRIAAGVFDSSTATDLGIVDQSNIGLLPKNWQLAMANTFLTSTSADGAGAAGLWIQSALLPTVTKSGTAKKGFTYTVTQPTANTTACSGVTGA